MAAICGLDWADHWHDVHIADERGTPLARRRVNHDEDGISALLALLREHAVELVAIERPDGLLVDTLLEAGYGVYALHPSAVERYRGRTRTRSAAAAQQSTGPGHPRHRPR